MTGTPARRILSSDGLPVAFLLALMAASGLFTVNIMPALVTGLEMGLGFSARQAGLVASANVYGAAAGAVFAALIAWRWNWRRTVAIALVGLMLFDLACTGVTGFVPLLLMRFSQGCAGGIVTGIGFSIIARTSVPDRVFGMLLFVQFGLGGLGIATLPMLVAAYGVPVLFLALASLALAVLLLLPLIPPFPMPPVPHVKAPATANETALALRKRRFALAALFLFQAAHMAISAYLLDIGRAARLPLAFVSTTAGIAGALGAAGSLGVVALGLRYGRLRPLTVAMSLALVSGLLLFGASSPLFFAGAVLLGSVTWTFALPFLLGLSATADASGRSAIWGSFVSKLGLATGPLIGSLSVSGASYSSLIVVASTLVVAALLFAGLAAMGELIQPRQADDTPC